MWSLLKHRPSFFFSLSNIPNDAEFQGLSENIIFILGQKRSIWFSGKIQENWHTSQLTFLPVYWNYQIVNGSVKILKLANFVEKTFLYLLKRSRPQTDEPLQRKMKNTTSTLKGHFWGWSVVTSVTYMLWHFSQERQKDLIFWT